MKAVNSNSISKRFQIYKKVHELNALMHVTSVQAETLSDAISKAMDGLSFKGKSRSRFLELYNVSALMKPSLGL